MWAGELSDPPGRFDHSTILAVLAAYAVLTSNQRLRRDAGGRADSVSRTPLSGLVVTF
jgi:hypothetical protein